MFERIIPYLSEKLSKEEIQDIILNEDNGFDEEIELLADKVKNGVDKELVIQEVEAACDNELFRELILKQFLLVLEPYEDMTYLRGLEYEQFKSLINYMFENIVICLEDLQTIINEVQLEKNEVIYIRKLLYTLLQYIIVKRHTFSYFKRLVFEMFRFDDNKTLYLWELYNNNKKQLVDIVVLENIQTCKDIRDGINQLNDFFSEILVDNEA